VYYDVWHETQTVMVYGIVPKTQSLIWLAAFAGRDAEHGGEA
jgi:hypothetical protein